MILYFSGTGNSRYAALRLGELTGEPVNSINQCLKEGAAIGLHSKNHYVVVSPVYAWRLPRVVERFIRQASFSGNTGIYFVLTCGDDVGNAAKYARRLCAKKGLRFCGLEPLVMPENYITMYQAPGREEAEQMIRRAEPELERFAGLIREGKPFPGPKVTLGGRVKSSLVNRLFYPLYVNARGYYATEACVGCGRCVKLCPLNNIRLENGRPVWGRKCTQCMACICGCPVRAVEYGKRTQGKERYYLTENGTLEGGESRLILRS